uniref:Uncharacterized protein n=1 Tax=Anguilla anguilla TaxID=7936 RepID=A0A0E9RG87_ANGAN
MIMIRVILIMLFGRCLSCAICSTFHGWIKKWIQIS